MREIWNFIQTGIDAANHVDIIAWLDSRQLFDAIICVVIVSLCLYLFGRMYDWWKQLRFSKTVLRDVYFALMFACVTIGFWAASNILNIVALDYTQPFVTLPARLGFLFFCLILYRPTRRLLSKPMAKVSLEDELAMNPNMVLVVDDDAGQMKVWRRILTQRGYYPEGVGSVAEALALIHNLPEMPRLMFIDINLPGGGNGIELARTIRQMGYKHPIIGMSGEPISDSNMKDFNEFLLKPMRAATFVEKVEYWIER